eukprot:TRINITY_DN4392_c0_g1_i2.p1 TRINITY_DN4392_c0_g1~~TRINITY_DN4392_c0_g1_i2.p1  ORF type:complete len:187 (-),score=67.40 TRINITY_DN4392_c0_g1_i2:96-656(-)
MFVPQPVYAVVFLYPITDVSDNFRKEEAKELEEAGQEVSENAFFCKQTIGNACGTIGCIHAILNNNFALEDGFFKSFLEDTKDMSPDDRAAYLESDKASSLEEAHGASAEEGQTVATEHENTNLHFIAFAQVDGDLYEFDGRKAFPINHGKTTDESFLKDTTVVLKKFMERDPEETNFTAMALCQA